MIKRRENLVTGEVQMVDVRGQGAGDVLVQHVALDSPLGPGGRQAGHSEVDANLVIGVFGSEPGRWRVYLIYSTQ